MGERIVSICLYTYICSLNFFFLCIKWITIYIPAISRPADSILPWDLNSKLSSYKMTKIERNESETLLLGFLLAKLFKMDPDVIIGHDIFGFDLTILLHRIQAIRVPHWSRIGRLRRKAIPKLNVRLYFYYTHTHTYIYKFLGSSVRI